MKHINYSHNPNDNDKNTISSLVIARIGGFMEFIIIPHDLSHDPILAQRNQKRGRGNGNGFGHYAEGLPNLSSNIDQITAIFTSDHHNDLTALAVHRVCRSDINQDQGDSDRTDFVVCAVGTSKKVNIEGSSSDDNQCDDDNDGCGVAECLTLWGLAFKKEIICAWWHIHQC
jgi:hypothetical protein